MSWQERAERAARAADAERATEERAERERSERQFAAVDAEGQQELSKWRARIGMPAPADVERIYLYNPPTGPAYDAIPEDFRLMFSVMYRWSDSGHSFEAHWPPSMPQKDHIDVYMLLPAAESGSPERFPVDEPAELGEALRRAKQGN